jgi:RNA polymerase sigma factor (sigma-70 family)
MYSDRELVEGALAGDGAVWREWDRRFRPILAGIARREFRMLPEDIEDLLQDLALALWKEGGRQLRAYRQKACLRSWLCAVWRHRCLDLKRRQKIRARCDLEGPHAGADERPRHSVEARLLVAQALRLAGERDRALLQLHFIQGWSQREIAACFEIPEKTIVSSLFRARKRLKRIVAKSQRSPVGS